MTAQYSEKWVSEGTKNVKQLLDQRPKGDKGVNTQVTVEIWQLWREVGRKRLKGKSTSEKLWAPKWGTLELLLATRVQWPALLYCTIAWDDQSLEGWPHGALPPRTLCILYWGLSLPQLCRQWWRGHGQDRRKLSHIRRWTLGKVWELSRKNLDYFQGCMQSPMYKAPHVCFLCSVSVTSS